MALQILAVLAGTANFAAVMTPVQMYQFAVITTIYVHVWQRLQYLNTNLE